MNIRAASRKEIYAFFVRECGGSDHVMPALFDSNRLTQCDELFVAEIDSRIVGAVAIASNGCDGSHGPTLATLYTAEEHQKQGIGRALCEFAIRRFVSIGKTPIFCDVTTGGMHATVKRLPDDLQKHLLLDLSYEDNGDEWETWREYKNGAWRDA